MKILRVTPLLKELIEKACTFEPIYEENSPQFRLAQVIKDEIKLILHKEKRLKQIFSYLKKNPNIKTTAEQTASIVFITTRILNRLCEQHLGCNFEKWRQHFIIMEAILLLEKKHSINYIYSYSNFKMILSENIINCLSLNSYISSTRLSVRKCIHRTF